MNKSCIEWGISEKLIKILRDNGIHEFFPVQNEIIPLLLRFNEHNCIHPRDMCVSAPTGSGKTISYALPIISILNGNCIRSLRAVIVLPTRELANQVFGVFCKLILNDELVVYNAIGHHDFEEEQQMLVGPFKSRFQCNNVNNIIEKQIKVRSNVDILVCTPGRLLDHLHKTENFTLNNLRFLVLDEADRLLGNAYHYWVKSLIDSTRKGQDRVIPLQRLLFSATLTDNPSKLSLLGIKNPLIIKVGRQISGKRKLQMCDENESQEDNDIEENISGYVLPSTLSESMRIGDSESRPLHLIALLMEAFGKTAVTKVSSAHAVCDNESDICLIFSSSVETTHRLCKLLQIFNNQLENDTSDSFKFGGKVEEISRLIGSLEREEILLNASRGKIKVLCSSDNMARGIDLPNVKLVINYDPPTHARTYVHRVGRTARANNSGHSVTLLKKGQVGAFRKMRISIENDSKTDIEDIISKCKLSKKTIENISNDYFNALKELTKYL